MRLATLLLLLVGSGFGSDKGAQAQDLIPLTVSSSKALPTPGPMFLGPSQCDEKSEIFLLVGNPQTPVIYKLLADGSHEVYGLIGDNAREAYYKAFQVDRDGGVSMLAGTVKGSRPVVFEFGNDPTGPPTKTPLDAPDGMDALSVRSFIKLKSGYFLLQGFFGEGADPNDRGRPYVAEFDPSGAFVRRLTDKEKAAVPATEWPAHAPALEGANGMIYVLLPDKVLVLSQVGKLVRTIKLVPPSRDDVPFQMFLSGGRLAIGFYKGPFQLGKKLESVYALFDASTGKQLRAYRQSSELDESFLACFSEEGFIFYKVGDDGRVTLLTARAD